MFFCTNCGKQLEEGTKFCDGCGQAVVISQTTPAAAAGTANARPMGQNPAVGTAQGSTLGGQPQGGQFNRQNNQPQNQQYSQPHNQPYNQPYVRPAQPEGQPYYQQQYTATNSGGTYAPYNSAPIPTENLLSRLSSKMNTNGIVWIIVACLQVIIGLYNLIIGLEISSYRTDGTTYIISGLFVLVVAALNFVNASKDIKYSKEILSRPVGIVAKFDPIGGYIGNLVYNILFGGIVGVVGSIFTLTIRNYVLTNRAYFNSLEAQFTSGQTN